MSTSHPHSNHPAIVTRLRRAHGHLRSVIDMIEAGRPCLDLATQLQAVERAVAEAKRALIHDHIDHCLDDVAEPLPEETKAQVQEFKQIAKFL